MKKLLIISVCAALMLSLCACGSTPTAISTSQTTSGTTAPTQTQTTQTTSAESTPSPSPEAMPVVSTQGATPIFWYCYTAKVQENNINLTNEFNETVGKEMGITVTAEYQGDYATMSQKLKAAVVAGTAPAVAVMEVSMLAPYTTAKILEPLDSFINRDQLDMNDFQPGFLTDSTFNGNTYSLPYLRSTPILYLNTTMLEQAGLDPKGPASWDDLEIYAKTVKEKTDKFGLTLYVDFWLFQSFMMAEGSSIYNDDLNATNMSNNASKKIIKTISDLRDSGSVNMLTSAQTKNLLADIGTQNCAMWFSSTGALTTFMDLSTQGSFNMSTAYMPKGSQYGCPTGGANLVMISKISDMDKEASWQFIKWMTQKEQTIKSSMTTGYLPSRISAANDPAMQAVYETMPQFKVALDQLQYAGGRTASVSEANAEIVKALEAIWVNKQDMDSTLSALKTKVDGLLNQN